MKKIERALVSVSNKEGITEFATSLAEMGVEILSTGGTAKALREAGLTVIDVSDFTGFPEMLDGRVKTLHPKVHAGLLYRRDLQEHEATMQEHGLQPIDLVCVNLYPFEKTVADPKVSFAEAIEQIDIGGPTMLRSAAKNMDAVTVVCDPGDYDRVLADMRNLDGQTSQDLRRELGCKVFARLAAYNAAIATYLGEQAESEEAPAFSMYLPSGTTLRYGENPHQSAIFYPGPAPEDPTIAHAVVLHGKEMSFNNYVDGDAALEAVKEFCGIPAVAIVKHTNPCGCATGRSLAEAFEAAWAGDPVSAFGSVIAVTQTVDLAAARCLNKRFVEVLIAPDYDADALEYLQAKSKDLRILKLHAPCKPAQAGQAIRQVNGGLLVQDRDLDVQSHWETPTVATFPDNKVALAGFGMRVCKHVKSNAILLVREYEPGCYSVLGMGAGQPNRVDAVRKLAITKARENLTLEYESLENPEASLNDFIASALAETVLISDAFFPFPDNIHNAHAAGICAVVQPGGSKRDGDVVAACNEVGIAMAFTGMRHFRH